MRTILQFPIWVAILTLTGCSAVEPPLRSELASDTKKLSDETLDKVIAAMQDVMTKASSAKFGELTSLSKQVERLKSNPELRDKLNESVREEMKKIGAGANADLIVNRIRSISPVELQEIESQLRRGSIIKSVVWPFCIVIGGC